jgi:hypothetical protein
VHKGYKKDNRNKTKIIERESVQKKGICARDTTYENMNVGITVPSLV